jgi:hypothetical protein
LTSEKESDVAVCRWQELREKSKKNWRAYHYDHDKVDEMIMQNDKRRPVNVAKDKMRLEDERDMAWEDYKTNEDDDAKEEAYKRWERLREQVQELEEKEEEEKQKLLQVQVPGLRTINARAKVMNRTVTKESKGINLEKNHLSCRPYVSFSFPSPCPPPPFPFASLSASLFASQTQAVILSLCDVLCRLVSRLHGLCRFASLPSCVIAQQD